MDHAIGQKLGAPASEEWIPLQGGGQIDISGDWWRARGSRGSISINFGLINDAMYALVPSLKKTIAWYLENHSEKTAEFYFRAIKHLLNSVSNEGIVNIQQIESEHLVNYYAGLPIHQKWYLSGLASGLFKWYDLGYPGIAAGAVKTLKEIRKKGATKGEAVRTMNPKTGPFSDIEFEALYVRALNAFEDGAIGPQSFLIFMLLLSLGPRPLQVALLKVCDIVLLAESKFGSNYELRLPIIKNGEPPRMEFREYYLRGDLGELLLEYAEDTKTRFVGLLDDPSQAPMFPIANIDTDLGWPEGFMYHVDTQSIYDVVVAVANSICVVSERTGKDLDVFPLRFRRSFGTRLGAEGHPATVIARLLGHHDTQNVAVYTGATIEAIDRIDRAVAFAMAPLANAFVGILVMDESEAVRGDDPSSRIFDPRISRSAKAMGSCGKYGGCKFKAPIACYTCRLFQPWLDGPHEEVYQYLNTERERLMTIDNKIASALDRTILAVAEVIRRCEDLLANDDDEEWAGEC